jgi:hypothetical protein
MVSRTTDRSNCHDLRSLDGPDSPDNLDGLALLIQRMMDAELLPDREGDALLAQADAAARALAAGDRAEARAHLGRIAHRTKRLVRRDVLPLTEGRAVLQAVHQAVTALITPSPAPLAEGDNSPPLPGISGSSDPG